MKDLTYIAKLKLLSFAIFIRGMVAFGTGLTKSQDHKI